MHCQTVCIVKNDELCTHAHNRNKSLLVHLVQKLPLIVKTNTPIPTPIIREKEYIWRNAQRAIIIAKLKDCK